MFGCEPQGAQLIELLRKNPAVAIPVVIIRLEQKEAEWLKVRPSLFGVLHGPRGLTHLAAASTCTLCGLLHVGMGRSQVELLVPFLNGGTISLLS